MDSTKYVNSYIDFAVGMIHEAINEKLQLRTQLKLANDLVAERDQVIFALNEKIEEIKKDAETETNVEIELGEEKRKSKQWEDSYHALNTKLAHFDNLTNQFNDIKAQLQLKNQEIQRLIKEQELFQEKTSNFEKARADFEKAKNEHNVWAENIVKLFESEKSELNDKINKLNEENEKLLLKVTAFEMSKKQINTPNKKKTNTVLPLQNNLEKVENNDF